MACLFRMAATGLKPSRLPKTRGCSRCHHDIHAGTAFEDKDGLLVCGACRDHIGTCEDPGCDEISRNAGRPRYVSPESAGLIPLATDPGGLVARVPGRRLRLCVRDQLHFERGLNPGRVPH